MLSAEDKADLQSLGADLAAAAVSPWQPGCIARAFATADPRDPVLTMQRWIDLDAARSPLILEGGYPETVEEVDAALEIFALSRTGLTPEELFFVMQSLRKACDDAFATALKMAQPDAETTAPADDGFGDWMPLLACLVTQCGLSLAEALPLRVDRAFALVAAMRRNQGWQVAGTPYAVRDVIEPEKANG